MKLIYGVKDKPKFNQVIVFAIQQLLAIMAATLVVPVIINSNVTEMISDGTLTWALEKPMSSTVALFGAGIGTLVYLLFTKFRSPVFLGSSFAFLGSMTAAFAGASSMALGYVGLILGAATAGLVYVIIAIIVKFAGVQWINKLMPPVVIGPTVTIIGLSLAGNAIGDLTKGNVTTEVVETVAKVGESGLPYLTQEASSVMLCSPLIALVCGLVTLAVTIICSVYGKKMIRLIPFIMGILSGYAVAAVFTVIGNMAGIDALKVINFTPFQALVADGVGLSTFITLPEFSFLNALGGFDQLNGAYIATVAVAYAPVAFVVFAEHIADHKNISSIIEQDLLEDPGLHRTLLGDGVGSMVGAVFGGCPNTTYGESVGCVAITGNASVITIVTTAIAAIAISFLSPFVAFVNTIPSCVMGGVCMALYGFIAVSGLKMVQKVDLEHNANLFTVSAILIAGIGGLTLSFGKVSITSIACALILGILVNILVNKSRKV